MSETSIKIISNSIHYKAPRWVEKPKYSEFNYIELSKNASIPELELFLVGMFGYNGIDFGTKPKIGFRNLLSKLNDKEVVLGGGIMFCDGVKNITPSCCCGIENWREIQQAIIDEKIPWMGHDPFPVIEYIGKRIIVWSDDCLGIFGEKKSKDSLVSIEFNKQDLNQKLINIENDIQEFVNIPLYNMAKELDAENANELCSGILSWLQV